MAQALGTLALEDPQQRAGQPAGTSPWLWKTGSLPSALHLTWAWGLGGGGGGSSEGGRRRRTWGSVSSTPCPTGWQRLSIAGGPPYTALSRFQEMLLPASSPWVWGQQQPRHDTSLCLGLSLTLRDSGKCASCFPLGPRRM